MTLKRFYADSRRSSNSPSKPQREPDVRVYAPSIRGQIGPVVRDFILVVIFKAFPANF